MNASGDGENDILQSSASTKRPSMTEWQQLHEPLRMDLIDELTWFDRNRTMLDRWPIKLIKKRLGIVEP